MASLSRHEALLRNLVLRHGSNHQLRGSHGTVIGALQKLLLGQKRGEVDILVFDGLGTFRLYERKTELHHLHRIEWDFSLDSLSFLTQNVGKITFFLWLNDNSLVLDHASFRPPYNRSQAFMQEVIDIARWHVLKSISNERVVMKNLAPSLSMARLGPATTKSGPKIGRRRQETRPCHRVLEVEPIYAPMFPPPLQPEDFIVLSSQGDDVASSYFALIQDIEEAQQPGMPPPASPPPSPQRRQQQIFVPATPSPTISPRNELADFEVAENVVVDDAQEEEEEEEEEEKEEEEEEKEEEEEEEEEEIPLDDPYLNMMEYKGDKYHNISDFHVQPVICNDETDRIIVLPRRKNVFFTASQKQPTMVRFPRLEIRKSTIPGGGCGLFAGEDIPAGARSLITEYGGIALDPSIPVPAAQTHIIALAASIGKGGFRLDGRSFAEPPFRLEDYIDRHEVMQMANSAMRATRTRPAVPANAAKLQNDARLFYDPSNWFVPRPRVFLRAKTFIRSGDEIFFDYSRGKAPLVADNDDDDDDDDDV